MVSYSRDSYLDGAKVKHSLYIGLKYGQFSLGFISLGIGYGNLYIGFHVSKPVRIRGKSCQKGK